jgi:hypothetical protein
VDGNGHFDSILEQYQGSGVYAGQEKVWAVEMNAAASLALGNYPGRLAGFENGRPVYLVKQTGGAGSVILGSATNVAFNLYHIQNDNVWEPVPGATITLPSAGIWMLVWNINGSLEVTDASGGPCLVIDLFCTQGVGSIGHISGQIIGTDQVLGTAWAAGILGDVGGGGAFIGVGGFGANDVIQLRARRETGGHGAFTTSLIYGATSANRDGSIGAFKLSSP